MSPYPMGRLDCFPSDLLLKREFQAVPADLNSCRLDDGAFRGVLKQHGIGVVDMNIDFTAGG